MPVTPITAHSQLDLKYTVDGLPHVLQMRCNQDESVGPASALEVITGTPVDASDAAAQVFTKIAPFFEAAHSSFDGYTLQKYVGGVYIPVESGATAVVPTGVTAYAKGFQWSFTFRDSGYQFMRFQFFETGVFTVTKVPYSALNVPMKALVDDILNLGAGHIGCWFKGRDGGKFPKSFLSAVTTYNGRVRRRRGIR